MSWLEILGFVAGGLTAVGICAGGLGYAYKAFKHGGDEIEDRVIALTKAENDQLSRQTEILRRQLADLEKRIDALQGENEMLRGLVMGTAVPPALDAALTGVANRIIERVDAAEDHLAQGVLAMTNAVTQLLGEIALTVKGLRAEGTG